MSGAQEKVRVYLVEDSPVAQQLLTGILSTDPGIEVIGIAANGQEALEFLRKQRPDVILMDLHLPGIEGLELTRHIMETHPLPIVVCSSAVDPTDAAAAFRALEAGAVGVVAKPAGPLSKNFSSEAAKLVETVKLMSEVKVIRRWPKRNIHVPLSSGITALTPARLRRVIAIGASTGGPPVLHTILSQLPKELAIPIVIVQHISNGFLEGMAEWLTTSTGYPVQVASHQEHLRNGRAYLAPDGYHIGLTSPGEIALSKQPPEHGMRPSVSYLFRSVRNVYGKDAIAVLLSGMGKDGAAELRSLKDAGAMTIAQDEESSIIHGMPGEAIRLGGAVHILNPEKIANLLAQPPV